MTEREITKAACTARGFCDLDALEKRLITFDRKGCICLTEGRNPTREATIPFDSTTVAGDTFEHIPDHEKIAQVHDFFAQGKWCQRSFEEDGKRCLIGGIARVWHISSFEVTTRLPVCALLERCIGELRIGRVKKGLAAWNDAPERTLDEVLTVLREAHRRLGGNPQRFDPYQSARGIKMVQHPVRAGLSFVGACMFYIAATFRQA